MRFNIPTSKLSRPTCRQINRQSTRTTSDNFPNLKLSKKKQKNKTQQGKETATVTYTVTSKVTHLPSDELMTE